MCKVLSRNSEISFPEVEHSFRLENTIEMQNLGSDKLAAQGIHTSLGST